MRRARRGLWIPLVLASVAVAGLWWLSRGAEEGGPAVLPDAALAPSTSQTDAALLADERLAGPVLEAVRTTADRNSAVAAAAGPRRAYDLELVEKLTGRPVEGALVRLSAGELVAEARSDAQGGVRLEWALGLAAALEVQSDQYVDVRRPVVDLDEGGAIELVRSGRIAGRLDGRARGIETGPVRLWTFAQGNYRGEPLAETRVDAEGRFAFGDLAPGSYAVGITPRHAPTTFESGIVVAEGLTEQVFLGMTLGVLLRGQVVRARTGEPISGVVVAHMPELQGINDDVERLAGSETTTGADGRFEIEGLPIGQVDLTLRTPWGSLATRKENITPDGQGRVRTIGIIGPAHVSGLVVDAQGNGIADAPVCVVREGDARALDWSSPGEVFERERTGAVLRGRTDGQGRFEFPEVQAAHTIYVVAWPAVGDGSTPAAVRLKELRDGEVRSDVVLRIVPGLPLAGRVVDAEGVGVPGVDVEVRARLGRVWAPSPTGVSGPDGSFAFPSVPATDLELRAERDGYRGARERVRLREDTEPVVLELLPASRVRGHVVDADGNAVSGAWVRASQTIDKEDTRRSTATCDDFGRFEFDSLGDGEWSLAGYATEWRTPRGAGAVVNLPGDPFVTLVLEPEVSPPPATVTGELVWAGTGGPVPGVRFDGMRGGSVTLEGSRFRITGVRPGKLQLFAKAEGMETVGFGVVELTPGGFTDVGRHEVRRTATLRVKVRDAQGRDLKAKVQLVRLPEERGGRPRGAARYDLRYDGRGKQYYQYGVARYRWELVVAHSKYETSRQEITLTGEPLVVTLQPRARKKTKGGG